MSEFPCHMMATQAFHQLGDISRDEPDLVFIDREEDEDFIGSWVEGFGFFNVRFPKETTRELTDEEVERFDGMRLRINSQPSFPVRIRR